MQRRRLALIGAVSQLIGATVAAASLIDNALRADGQVPARMYADPDCRPTIDLVSVPPIGSLDMVQGSVQLPMGQQDYGNYSVVLYIHITSPFFNGWVVKPATGDFKITSIGEDGTFSANYVTGGIDDQADRMIAYLVPASSAASMPEPIGAPLDETAISNLAIAYASAMRGPRASVFSGSSYHKKSGVFDPGPANLWSLEDNATSSEPSFFDSDTGQWETGPLRLSVQYRCDDGTCGWHCTEQVGIHNYGYGTYHWSLRGRVDLLQESLVLGLFTYEFPTPEQSANFSWGEREIDFEFAKWSGPMVPKQDDFNAQMVIQPFELGYLNPFNVTLSSEEDSVHCIFKWQEGVIEYEVYAVPAGSSAPELVESTTFTGAIVPTPGNEHVHMNLWIAKWAILGFDNQYNPLPADTFSSEDVLSASITAFKFSPVENALRDFYPKPINPGRCEAASSGEKLCIAQGIFLSAAEFETACVSEEPPSSPPPEGPASPPPDPEPPVVSQLAAARLCGEKPVIYLETLFQAPEIAEFKGEDIDECIVGTPGDDIIYGGGGDDVIIGLGGSDFLFGGHGDDWLYGMGGSDALYGDQGRNFLSGGVGADVLVGCERRDTTPFPSKEDVYVESENC